ncbi:hypothetical protein, partial [Paenibacillus alginolyticus]|uniref:hypothetical protein n=1 Tax=Paenibacillus alginolyticus TaxID=59839 RepID=UPI001C273923
ITRLTLITMIIKVYKKKVQSPHIFRENTTPLFNFTFSVASDRLRSFLTLSGINLLTPSVLQGMINNKLGNIKKTAYQRALQKPCF